MGLSFKENCNDLRNTQVFNLYRNLIKNSFEVDIYDPLIKAKDARETYKIELIENPIENYYDAIIIAVAHENFKQMGFAEIKKLCKESYVIYDLKYVLARDESDLRL